MVKKTDFVLMLCVTTILGCSNSNSRNSYQEEQRRIEEQRLIDNENRLNAQREYQSLKASKERDFGIHSAESWLYNKITEASSNAAVVDINVYPNQTINKTIKTLTVRYADQLNMDNGRFLFYAEGVTYWDRSFRYEFAMEKINGLYSVAKTNSPHGFLIY
jgi:uncharacterized lipoprotein NlpE involved in copper resistance